MNSVAIAVSGVESARGQSKEVATASGDPAVVKRARLSHDFNCSGCGTPVAAGTVVTRFTDSGAYTMAHKKECERGARETLLRVGRMPKNLRPPEPRFTKEVF